MATLLYDAYRRCRNDPSKWKDDDKDGGQLLPVFRQIASIVLRKLGNPGWIDADDLVGELLVREASGELPSLVEQLSSEGRSALSDPQFRTLIRYQMMDCFGRCGGKKGAETTTVSLQDHDPPAAAACCSPREIAQAVESAISDLKNGAETIGLSFEVLAHWIVVTMSGLEKRQQGKRYFQRFKTAANISLTRARGHDVHCRRLVDGQLRSFASDVSPRGTDVCSFVQGLVARVKLYLEQD